MRRYRNHQQPKAIPLSYSRKQVQNFYRQWLIFLVASLLVAFGASLTLMVVL